MCLYRSHQHYTIINTDKIPLDNIPIQKLPNAPTEPLKSSSSSILTLIDLGVTSLGVNNDEMGINIEFPPIRNPLAVGDELTVGSFVIEGERVGDLVGFNVGGADMDGIDDGWNEGC